MNDAVRSKAGKISLLALDVDGVLTDGGLYYLVDDSFAVRFDVRDGLGLVLAQRAGIQLALISGRSTPQVASRASQLGIEEVHLGVTDKLSVLRGILARHGIDAESVCYVGDDLVDVPTMEHVGLAVSVPDATEPVRAAADWVTMKRGGHGAVREIVDALLAAREGNGGPS